MNFTYLPQVKLICPACRQMGPSGMLDHEIGVCKVFHKESEYLLEGLLQCTNLQCNRLYPVYQGVPAIFRDIAIWWETLDEKSRIGLRFQPEWQPFFHANPELLALDFPEQRNLKAAFFDAHFPEYSQPEIGSALGNNSEFWNSVLTVIRNIVPTSEGIAADLGCSAGRLTFEMARIFPFAVGLDVDFHALAFAASLQREGTASFERPVRSCRGEKVHVCYDAPPNVLFVQTDVLDPPIRAGAFQLTAAVNVLDSIRAPLILLGQMDAMLRDQGSCLICSPFTWDQNICRPEKWLEDNTRDAPEMLKDILSGNFFPEMGLNYRVELEMPDIPWIIRVYNRFWTIYSTYLLCARKL